MFKPGDKVIWNGDICTVVNEKCIYVQTPGVHILLPDGTVNCVQDCIHASPLIALAYELIPNLGKD